MNSQSVEQEYVKLAIGILREAPTAETQSLRAWATRVLSKYSAIALSEIETAALESGRAVIPSASVRFEYDSMGRLTGVTDPRVGIMEYSYDPWGHVVRRSQERSK
jgi:YD repeat-containing protein